MYDEEEEKEGGIIGEEEELTPPEGIEDFGSDDPDDKWH